jgi:hypothetical protein
LGDSRSRHRDCKSMLVAQKAWISLSIASTLLLGFSQAGADESAVHALERGLRAADEARRASDGSGSAGCGDVNRAAVPRKRRLFRSDEPLSIEMVGLFPTFAKKKGLIRYESGGTLHEMPVDFEPRGESRKLVCKEFPPFKVILPKGGAAKGPLFKGLDRDLKFVTPCKWPLDAEWLDRMRGEYALYRLLEASGLPGFATRMVEVTYRDARGSVLGVAPGFFIENLKDLGARISPKHDPHAVLALSEALTTNHDINPDVDKNVRRLKDRQGETTAFVPFDFDLANLLLASSSVHPMTVTPPEQMLGSVFRKHGPALVLPLGEMIRRRQQMLDAVRRARLEPAMEERMLTYVNGVVDAAKAYLDKIHL